MMMLLAMAMVAAVKMSCQIMPLNTLSPLQGIV